MKNHLSWMINRLIANISCTSEQLVSRICISEQAIKPERKKTAYFSPMDELDIIKTIENMFNEATPFTSERLLGEAHKRLGVRP
jgi:hypothetical protein